MSGNYATDHESALADVAAAGASVSFTLKSAGSYNPTAGGFSSPTTTTVAGSAIELDGDPDVYRDLSLVQSSPLTLFFVPSTYGALPLPGYAATWADGIARTVRKVTSLSPDGVAIAATIVMAV